MRDIYLDHAATTPLSSKAREAMLQWMGENFANASSPCRRGMRANMAIQDAAEAIAQTMGANADEIFFTSGGTEANNWAIVSAFEALCEKGRHIITTAMEHESVLAVVRYLERERGARVTYLPVDAQGHVSADELASAIGEDTVLVSIMMANNEVGTIQNIKEMANICHKLGVWFHTDAVQAYGHIPVDVAELGVDLLSVSGHKVHGPVGVGLLYIRKGLRIGSFLHGGSQQRGRRAGTLPVANIVGFAQAAVETCQRREETAKYLTCLRDHAFKRLIASEVHATINGDPKMRLPGNVHVSFEGIDGESLVIALDQQGICVSAGSACTSGSTEPSHVLLAMGRSHAQARSCIRMTIGEEMTKEDLDAVLDIIIAIVQKTAVYL